jgi:hypothetical protein
LKFEVVALELIALEFQRLYMLASHFEHLTLARVTVHNVFAIEWIIVAVTVAAVSSLLWQNIEKGFELSVKAVAVSLFDEVMGCSSPALF